MAIVPSFQSGGAERVTIELCNYLARSHTVTIVSFQETGPLRYLVSSNIRVFSTGKARLRSSFWHLLILIRKVKPAVIFSSIGYLNIANILLAFLSGTEAKVCIREANMPSQSLTNLKFSMCWKWLYKKFYSRADCILCSSAAMKSEFKSLFKVDARRLLVISNPVNVDLILKSTSNGTLPESQSPFFLACGRMVHQKGFDRLIVAIKSLSKPKVKLMIIGDGPEKKNLERLAKQLEVDDQVIFLGYVKEPWFWFMRASVLLVTSRWEGMPNVVLEALVCGLPVLATPECKALYEVQQEVAEDMLVIEKWGDPFIRKLDVYSRKDNPIRRNQLPLRFHKDEAANQFVRVLRQLIESR